MKVPFNRPALTGREFEYMRDAVERAHLSGDGHYTKLCARRIEELTGGGDALLTTSCSHALDMTALLLDVGPGDEIIMPSFTFVSTANAFVLRGARPVFVDVRPDTLNLDERLLEAAITGRTRAIVVVHYAGVACDMDAIGRIASAHAIPVIEDNAHGLFGAYHGSPLGSFGVFATQSFHETKNIMCGEGGALVVNAPQYLERAVVIREKGTNRSRFFRGLVDKYSWVEPGSSYLPSELLTAFLAAQLDCAPATQQVRRHVWERYDAELAPWAEHLGIARPTVPPGCVQPYHLYYLLMPSTEDRDDLIAFLKQREIGAVFHYVPLHVSEYGAHLGYRRGELPVSESSSERLIRLPLFNDMSDAEQDYVIENVRAFRPRSSAVPA